MLVPPEQAMINRPLRVAVVLAEVMVAPAEHKWAAIHTDPTAAATVEEQVQVVHMAAMADQGQ